MNILSALGHYGFLLYQMGGLVVPALTHRADRSRILAQMEALGIRSIPLVLVVGFFAGSLIAWQAAYQFKGLISLSILGGQAQRVIVMEIGPVLTALILAGRIGASLAAEIGTLQITEQIDALRSLGLAPVRYLVLPRCLGLVLMMPAITVFSCLTGVLGAFVVSNVFLGLTAEVFLGSIRTFFDLRDLAGGIFKSTVFGLIIASIGAHVGMEARGGAAGVGQATVQAFVIIAISILVADYFLWLILF